MSSTIRNMWKVICDRKCGAVIMLSDLIENGMVCFTMFTLHNRLRTFMQQENNSPVDSKKVLSVIMTFPWKVNLYKFND